MAEKERLEEEKRKKEIQRKGKGNKRNSNTGCCFDFDIKVEDF